MGCFIKLKSARVQKFKNSRVQGLKKFKGSRVQGFRGSKVQGFKGSCFVPRSDNFKGLFSIFYFIFSDCSRVQGFNASRC
jgi:hypothetical protein